jgi:hypothetical protein
VSLGVPSHVPKALVNPNLHLTFQLAQNTSSRACVVDQQSGIHAISCISTDMEQLVGIQVKAKDVGMRVQVNAKDALIM